MSMINKEIDDFTVQAFHNDDFETVTEGRRAGEVGRVLLLPGRLHVRVPHGA